MTDDVESYVRSKGWEIKRRTKVKGEINLILDCPLCGAVTTKTKRRFWIASKTSVWLCNECGKTGNLYTLRKTLGDLVPDKGRTNDDDPAWMRAVRRELRAPATPEKLAGHEDVILKQWPRALRGNPEVMLWLTKDRGLPEEFIDRFKLGLRSMGGQLWLVLPYLTEGRPVCVKYRSVHGKQFRRAEGCPSPLFNLDALEGEMKRVYVVEGELDAISMEVMGFAPTVSLPNGSKSIDDEHAAWLERFDEVVVVTDNDEAGKDAAERIASRLGRYRCLRVTLPRKDANACLAGDMVDEARVAVRNAKAMSDTSIASIMDVFEAAIDGGQALDSGRSTGWGMLDSIIGGFRPNEWTAISGDTGAGKTTFQMGCCTNAAKQGDAVFKACLELHPHTVAVRWAGQLIGKNIHSMGTLERVAAKDLLAPYAERCFIVPRQGSVPLKEITGMLEFVVRRYGVSMWSVDHLDFVTDDPDDRKSINSAINMFDAGVSHFAVHGLLGVHPRGVEYDKRTKNVRRINMGDLKGSSNIKQRAHNVLIVWPEGDDGIVPVSVQKKRWEGRTGKVPSSALLTFDKVALIHVESNLDRLDYKRLAAGDDDD